MKNKFFFLSIVLLFSVSTFAQTIDSTKVNVIKTISNTDSLRNSGTVKKVLDMFMSDTVPPVKPRDSIKRFQLNDTLDVVIHLDSVGNYMKIDSVRRMTQLDSLKIKMESLLKPFYTIEYDSLTNEYTFTERYRMTVNNLTKDTTYIPLPKEKSYIAPIKNLVIDTLKVVNPIKIAKIDTTKYADDPVWWEKRNSIGLDFNEAAFVNWNAGGNNSVSGLFKVDLVRLYKKLHLLWNNELYMRYGLNSQQDRELRKTEDRFEFKSIFGYRRDTVSNWFYSMKFNFKTQFTNGYKYPNTDNPISRLFSPAYLFLGAGSHYEIKQQKFSLYLSPITLKSTFVFDDDLSNSGAFGVTPGQRSRNEFGFLVESLWNKEIVKNVLMTNKLSLYSDYLNNFGNVDVDWELNFTFRINKFMRASIGGHMIYDDDVKYKEDINNDGTLETLGARVQLKQFLGIGVMYRF
ncbi:DUF3078 domain-containing protein [Aureibaculum sp. 2210JD6-5]|uniref:DUF3078 domain-containing protein n=1 Tax=Aureibaculum sp. 2210JD6-5 TaxID=3103957 RepID=UPI002AACCD67|nr:DUF3078 domain-containing protein [Aureibaculum sp. 2210JD6-5]MDY7394768.1 DUF3078 domain-containing protein [Aureibaculum sp. 2210JD6-5]